LTSGPAFLPDFSVFAMFSFIILFIDRFAREIEQKGAKKIEIPKTAPQSQ